MHSGNGYYIYIETSSARLGYKAQITTPEISPSVAPMCLTFWYHMYGETIGTLRVFSMYNDSVDPNKIIWQTSGDHGNMWLHTSITLNDWYLYKVCLSLY